MSGEKHPIIAHGELYVEPIVKKSRPIDKSIPHEYECFLLGIHTVRKVCGGYQPATAGF